MTVSGGDDSNVVADAVVSEAGDCSETITSSDVTGACITVGGKKAQLPTLLFLGVQKGATTSLALQMMQVFDDMRVCGSTHVDDNGNGGPNVEKHYYDAPENYDFPQVMRCILPIVMHTNA